MDAVAERSEVSRMTVYNQFHSESGLLEGLADYLATKGGMQRMPEVFTESEPIEALRKFVGVFTAFWSSDRLLMRRLRAFGVLHPALYRALRDRDDWRRQGAETLVARFRSNWDSDKDRSDASDLLSALCSFETFDALASRERSPEEVAAVVFETILRAWRLDRPGSRTVRRRSHPRVASSRHDRSTRVGESP